MQSKVVRHNGVLKIDIDGKLYSPLSFKSFRPNPRNVSEFYNAGVRLFSVLSSGITSALGVSYSLYTVNPGLGKISMIFQKLTTRWICL